MANENKFRGWKVGDKFQPDPPPHRLAQIEAAFIKMLTKHKATKPVAPVTK